MHETSIVLYPFSSSLFIGGSGVAGLAGGEAGWVLLRAVCFGGVGGEGSRRGIFFGGGVAVGDSLVAGGLVMDVVIGSVGGLVAGKGCQGHSPAEGAGSVLLSALPYMDIGLVFLSDIGLDFCFFLCKLRWLVIGGSDKW